MKITIHARYIFLAIVLFLGFAYLVEMWAAFCVGLPIQYGQSLLIFTVPFGTALVMAILTAVATRRRV